MWSILGEHAGVGDSKEQCGTAPGLSPLPFTHRGGLRFLPREQLLSSATVLLGSNKEQRQRRPLSGTACLHPAGPVTVQWGLGGDPTGPSLHSVRSPAAPQALSRGLRLRSMVTRGGGPTKLPGAGRS